MNDMTVNSTRAPWNDTSEWVECKECWSDGYIFGTNSIKKCTCCGGEGEIKE